MFAIDAIPAGTLIERVPVILLPKSQVFGNTDAAKHAARISWYVYDWLDLTSRPYVALALGYGSIYNHSYTPNARYVRVPPDMIDYVALQDIVPGEEILINYNGDPDDRRPVGFDL